MRMPPTCSARAVLLASSALTGCTERLECSSSPSPSPRAQLTYDSAMSNVKRIYRYITNGDLDHLRMLKEKIREGIAGSEDAQSLAELIEIIETRPPIDVPD